MSRSADDLARLHDLIDGRLPPDEARALEARIAADERLRRRYGELQLVVSGLAEFAEERAPSDFADRVLAAVDEKAGEGGPSPEAAARPWALRLVGRSSAVAAACAAVLTVGILLSSRDGALAPRGAAVDDEAPFVGLADKSAPNREKGDAWTQGDGRLGRLGEEADRYEKNARDAAGERRRRDEESATSPERRRRDREEVAKAERPVPPLRSELEEGRDAGAASAEDALERAARVVLKGAPPTPTTAHAEEDGGEAEAEAEAERLGDDADDRTERTVRQVLRELPRPSEPAPPAAEATDAADATDAAGAAEGSAASEADRESAGIDEVLRRLRGARAAGEAEVSAAGGASPTIVRFVPIAGFAGRAYGNVDEGPSAEWDRLLLGVGHDARPLESLAEHLPASERAEAAARLRADAGDRIRLVEVDAGDLPRLVANATSLGLLADGLVGSVPATESGAITSGGSAFLTGVARSTGPTGPTGPAGPAGPTGAAGPTGPGDAVPDPAEAKAKRKSGPASGPGSESGPARGAKEAADDVGPSTGAGARVVLILVRERP